MPYGKPKEDKRKWKEVEVMTYLQYQKKDIDDRCSVIRTLRDWVLIEDLVS